MYSIVFTFITALLIAGVTHANVVITGFAGADCTGSVITSVDYPVGAGAT